MDRTPCALHIRFAKQQISIYFKKIMNTKFQLSQKGGDGEKEEVTK